MVKVRYKAGGHVITRELWTLASHWLPFLWCCTGLCVLTHTGAVCSSQARIGGVWFCLPYGGAEG